VHSTVRIAVKWPTDDYSFCETDWSQFVFNFTGNLDGHLLEVLWCCKGYQIVENLCFLFIVKMSSGWCQWFCCSRHPMAVHSHTVSNVIVPSSSCLPRGQWLWDWPFPLTPSTPAVLSCCCSKGLALYWSNPLFFIFEIRELWHSVLSARAPECQKLKSGLDQYGKV